MWFGLIQFTVPPADGIGLSQARLVRLLQGILDWESNSQFHRQSLLSCLQVVDTGDYVCQMSS